MNGQFVIKINLPDTLTRGYAALDLCRRLGLPDCTPIETVKWTSVCCSVDEAFARTHFCADVNLVELNVELDWLVPGDLVAEAPNNLHLHWRAVFNPALENSRISELWVARYNNMQE